MGDGGGSAGSGPKGWIEVLTGAAVRRGGQDAGEGQREAATVPGGAGAGAAGHRSAGPEVDAGTADEPVPLRAAAAEAATLPNDSEPIAPPGPPVDRRSPYMIGLLGAAGVATTYGLVQLIIAASGMLVLIGLAMFIAIGLDPAVGWLMRWRLPRWAAVTVVVLVALLAFGGFLAAAIPPLVSQATAFIHELPSYLRDLRNHSSTLGRLDARYHIEKNITSRLGSSSAMIFGGILGAGKLVLGATTSVVTVLALSVYLLADMPRIRRLIYRLIPARRRTRAILLGDEMFAKVGGYVLGNLLTSLIAGAGTFVWLFVFRVPYPLLLAILVALLDLVPIIGSTVAGIVVSLVALTVSLPVAIATLAFYVVYRLAEDYLIVPKVIGRTVAVPATATFVAVLLGGAMLGLIGALIAIPVAAAIGILLRETVFPRLDKS